MNELLLLTCSHQMVGDQECCQAGGQVGRAWRVEKWSKVKHSETAHCNEEHLSTRYSHSGKGLDSTEICRASAAVHESFAFHWYSYCKAPGVTFQDVSVGVRTTSGSHKMIQSLRRRMGSSLEGVLLNSSIPLHGKSFLEREGWNSLIHRDLLSTLTIHDWFAVD